MRFRDDFEAQKLGKGLSDSELEHETRSAEEK